MTGDAAADATINLNVLRKQIEAMTTAATARAFDCLSPAERGEFAELVAEARACLD